MQYNVVCCLPFDRKQKTPSPQSQQPFLHVVSPVRVRLVALRSQTVSLLVPPLPLTFLVYRSFSNYVSASRDLARTREREERQRGKRGRARPAVGEKGLAFPAPKTHHWERVPQNLDASLVKCL